jgi:(5-formylfuran-3-yl)methyl phosphate synthase
LKLLVSVVNEGEAIEAVKGGADIIDVKNPREGSLGAHFPWVVKGVKEATTTSVKVSCTLGDSPNLPGSMSLAALGAATTGVDYIKTGLYAVKSKSEAIYLMRNIVKAAKGYNQSIAVVATGYADAVRVGAVNPLFVPEIAHRAEADVAMLDTAVKDGSSMFSFLSAQQLKRFVKNAHDHNLDVGFAGSLKGNDLEKSYSLGADIFGVRAAACTSGNRVRGRIDCGKVRQLVGTKNRCDAQLTLRRGNARMPLIPQR